MNTINNTLSVIRSLRAAYEDTFVEPFNLFSVLRSSHDEVGLHSKFLVALLDPSGRHTLGAKPVELLLPFLKIEGFSLGGLKVCREYEGIDILLVNSGKQAVIIENKIYAEDQEKQLERYYKTMKKEGYEDVWVSYLTLTGYEPSKQSVGDITPNINSDGDSILLLSYRTDILNWLSACKKHAVDYSGPLRQDTNIVSLRG